MRMHIQAENKNLLLNIVLMLGIFIISSLCWHEYAMKSAVNEFTSAQLQDIKKHVIVMLFLQSLALLSVYAITRIKALSKMVIIIIPMILGSLLVLNVFSLCILHMEKFAVLKFESKLILGMIGLFIAYTASRAFLENRIFALIGLSLATILLFVLSSTQVTNVSKHEAITPLGKSKKGVSNIYFISFDSIIPESLAQKFLKTNAPYIDILKKHDAIIFKNGLSAFIPTKPAMNSLLTIDHQEFVKPPEAERYHYFSGKRKSILSDFMHKNGYQLQTIFKGPYLGTEKGPHVDYYYNGDGDLDAVNSCDHVSDGVFIGYCNASLAKIIPTALYHNRQPKTLENDKEFDRLLTPTIRRIEVVINSNRPWFTMSHIYAPGHTKINHRYDNPDDVEEYKKRFEEKSAIAARYLDEVVTLISTKDPTAIVLITGDHGTYISRGINPNSIDDPVKKEEAKRFFTLDQNGINIAVWSGKDCSSYFEDLHEAPVTINLDVARRVIECATNSRIFNDKPLVIDQLDTFKPHSYFKPYIYE